MTEYKGIIKSDFPKWNGWDYIALYSSITDDFEDDKPLQRLVVKHYRKKKLQIALFNSIPYLIILFVILK